jgi:Subtilase family
MVSAKGVPRRNAAAAEPMRKLLLFLLVWVVGVSTTTTIGAASSSSSPLLRKQVEAERVRQRQRYRRRRTTAAAAAAADVQFRRVTIECSTAPLFKCRTCHDALVLEQEAVIAAIQTRYPTATVQETTHKLLNTLFVNLPFNENDNEDAVVDRFISNLPGVVKVYPSEDWGQLDIYNDTYTNTSLSQVTTAVNGSGSSSDGNYSKPLRDIGVDVAATTFCATGKGVRVAVLDGGVDYTHKSFGGPGTVAAYQAAYGTDITDIRNKQRDGLFPTAIVTEGYDYLGDTIRDGDAGLYAEPDNDPIDLAGHGTGVAHAIRSVAPEADIIAVKICTTTGNTCPDFAVVQGLEYILDPNQDGSLDDAVHIVNLSLGRLYSSSYYSVLAKAIEEVFSLGILPVLAAGNNGNFPFILGGEPATPNALTVSATAVFDDETIPQTMASYSSRGPGEANLAKPDIVAPGGPYGLAYASTGDKYRQYQGTSFSAPLVAGGAALIKEKCPECSPFSIKAILMNHGHHDIHYSLIDNSTAPVTLQGSGEMQLQRSLAATFWVYSLEDVNPSISLGLVNAASDMVLTRRLRIVKLSNKTETVTLGYEFRSSLHQAAVSILFSPETLTMNGSCQNEYFVNVEFQIDASKAPSNHMYSGGEAGNDARNLDFNEVDGWLLLTTSDDMQQVGLPFHMILRKAANVTIGTSTFDNTTLDMTKLPVELTVNIQNVGAETAQIDAFQLLYTSGDDAEQAYGIADPPSDLRYVGYRTVPVNRPGCTDLIEFAIQTWEKQLTLSYTHFYAWFDLNFDEQAEQAVYNSAYRLGSVRSEMRRINTTDGLEYCIGFPPDHATNTANTVIRLCSEDIGMQAGGTVNVAVSSFSFPDDSVADIMTYRKITIPQAGLSAPSYNIQPGATLNEITVSGTGTTPEDGDPLGLLLFTNSYRSSTSTGSATRASETVVITRAGTVLPEEKTPDLLVFPVALDFVGPSCSWTNTQSQCTGRMLAELAATTAIAPMGNADVVPSKSDAHSNQGEWRNLQSETTCPEFPVPRLNATNIVLRPSSTDMTPTAAPTLPAGTAPALVLVPTAGPTVDIREGMGTPVAAVPPLPINDRRPSSGGSRQTGSAATLWSLLAASAAIIYL